jgi:hypothetical protein
MITWCGDPGWAAWMMTGGRSPAARWARRRLCEAERDAAVIEHAALRIRLHAGFLAARCLGVRMALLRADAGDLIASTGGCGDRLRPGGHRPMASPEALTAAAVTAAPARHRQPFRRPSRGAGGCHSRRTAAGGAPSVARHCPGRRHVRTPRSRLCDGSGPVPLARAAWARVTGRARRRPGQLPPIQARPTGTVPRPGR